TNTVGNTTYYIISDLGNCQSAAINVTIVINPLPVADFTATPTSGNIPLNVVYTDNSTGNGLTYAWDFGNGNIDSVPNTSNIFTQLGNYTTTLTITDNAGCTDVATVVIN